MRNRAAALLAALAFLPANAAAEDGKFDLSVELRARGEYVDGQYRPGVIESDHALLTRVLVFAEYDAGPIRIGGEVNDARSYFNRRGGSTSTNEVDALEPIQAYVATDVSPDVRLLAGRFTMNLGSRRLISRNNFRNTINSYTGARLDLGGAKRGATLFWFIPQRRLPDDAEAIRDNAFELDSERGGPRLWGAFVHDLWRGDTVEAYAIRLAENDADEIQSRDRHLWTAGGRLLRQPKAGRFDYEIESAIQWGTTRQTSAATDRLDRRVRAAFVHARAGWTFATDWQPRVSLAFDGATGDGPGTRFTRFDPLVSSRGPDFGPTSYYGPLTRANILSAELRVEARPSRRFDTYFTARPLWLASATDSFALTGVRDPAGNAGRFAGVNYELRLRRTLVPDTLRLAFGASVLDKGRFLRDAANAPDTGDTHYGYLELTATL